MSPGSGAAPHSGVRPRAPSLSVIKLGGVVLDDAETVDVVWQQVAELRAGGEDVVLVHGGGSQATALAGRLGHAPRMIHGRRVTGDIDLDVALWTFRGALNSRLVAAAYRAGISAAGISGADGGTLRVRRRPPWQIDGETVDFGWVGDVDEVDPRLLESLLAAGIAPVVAPLGIDGAGSIYNVNADTVAVAIAGALGAASLLFVAPEGGLLRDLAEPASRIPTCDRDLMQDGVSRGWITEGMRVKLETALQAVDSVPEVAIVSPSGICAPASGTVFHNGS